MPDGKAAGKYAPKVRAGYGNPQKKGAKKPRMNRAGTRAPQHTAVMY